MQIDHRVRPIQQSIREERGQSAVEFSLIALTLALVIIAVVDLGRAMSIYSFLAGAAQAAARAGSVSSDMDVIEAAARARMTSFPSESVVLEVDQSGNYTEVTLTYVLQPITPLIAQALGTDSLTLSNTARVRRLGSGGGEGAMAPTSTPSAPTTTPPPPTNTPSGPTNTPPPPTNTPVPTNTPAPTPTPCWPPGHCR